MSTVTKYVPINGVTLEHNGKIYHAKSGNKAADVIVGLSDEQAKAYLKARYIQKIEYNEGNNEPQELTEERTRLLAEAKELKLTGLNNAKIETLKAKIAEAKAKIVADSNVTNEGEGNNEPQEPNS
jgi:hypothetical protein